MKKTLFAITLASIMLMPVTALAANNSSSNQGQTNGNSTQSVNSSQPTQSQASTQNQGNATQIQTQSNNPETGLMTQDQIRTRLEADLKTVESEYSPQNEMATQRMSSVSQAVQNLLQSSYRLESQNKKLGEQVRAIAQNQVQTHDKINQSLDKAEKRSGFAKFFVGPNYKELSNARQQMEQNQLKIQELNQIAAQVSNQADQTELKNQIQTLEEQNTSLKEQLQKDTTGFSLFGWLNRWINKY